MSSSSSSIEGWLTPSRECYLQQYGAVASAAQGRIALLGDLSLYGYFARVAETSMYRDVGDVAEGTEAIVFAWPRVDATAPAWLNLANASLSLAEGRGIPFVFIPPRIASVMLETLDLVKASALTISRADRQVEWYQARQYEPIRLDPIHFAGHAQMPFIRELDPATFSRVVSRGSYAVHRAPFDMDPSPRMIRTLHRFPELLLRSPGEKGRAARFKEEDQATLASHGFVNRSLSKTEEVAGAGCARDEWVVKSRAADEFAVFDCDLDEAAAAWRESGLSDLRRLLGGLVRRDATQEFMTEQVAVAVDSVTRDTMDGFCSELFASPLRPAELLVLVEPEVEEEFHWRTRGVQLSTRVLTANARAEYSDILRRRQLSDNGCLFHTSGERFRGAELEKVGLLAAAVEVNKLGPSEFVRTEARADLCSGLDGEINGNG